MMYGDSSIPNRWGTGIIVPGGVVWPRLRAVILKEKIYANPIFRCPELGEERDATGDDMQSFPWRTCIKVPLGGGPTQAGFVPEEVVYQADSGVSMTFALCRDEARQIAMWHARPRSGP